MRKTVLIADRDPLALKILASFLTESGYRVVTATSGPKAIEVMLETGPSMLVTDLHLPDAGGLDLCRRVRTFEGFGWVYTVVLSPQHDEELMVEAFEAGADDYLTRPFSERELVARLRAGERIVDLEQDLAKKTREIFRYNAEMEIAYQKLAKANEMLNHQASTDSLTELPNRRAAMKSLKHLWEESIEHDEPLACCMLDIDEFKEFNDSLGHEVGDIVLVESARTMRRTARTGEEVYRFGGEEFLLLCPHSSAAMAAAAAERTREAVATMGLLHEGQALQVRVSVGVAERTAEMESPDDLLRVADFALYDAKKGGRNCVRVAPTAPHSCPNVRNASHTDRASA